MKSITIFLTCVVAILSQTAAGRIVDPSENDPLRVKWFLWEDENGIVRNESLLEMEENPRDGSVSDIKLMLYTKSNPTNYESLNPADITNLTTSTFFNPTRPNVFIIHGWRNNWESPMNTLIRDALMETRDVNVFVVDWDKVAHKLYSTSKNAMPGIGAAVGSYINDMMAHFSIGPENVMIIGHSLGAHAAGSAGAAMLKKPHLVVGLDPAGPLISFDDLSYRVDPSDGEYVQIIHTNGRMFGFRSSLGTSDYHPNGGGMQPGCWIDTCAHSRAYELYAESLRNCKFQAINCDSYDNYMNGDCNLNKRSLMGCFDVDKTVEGDHYLLTRSKPPYYYEV